MASCFSHILSCLGKRPRDSSTEGERRRLLENSSAQTEPSDVQDPPRPVFDRQAFEERLEQIVRRTEVKMVNVASAYPFNLRNRPQEEVDAMTQHQFNASSSRSASTSTVQGSNQPSPNPAAARYSRRRPILTGLREMQPPSLPPLHPPPTHSKPNSRSRSRSESTASSSKPGDSPSPTDKEEKPGKKDLLQQIPPRRTPANVFGLRIIHLPTMTRQGGGATNTKASTTDAVESFDQNGTISPASDEQEEDEGEDEGSRGTGDTNSNVPPPPKKKSRGRPPPPTQPRPIPAASVPEFHLPLTISWDD